MENKDLDKNQEQEKIENDPNQSIQPESDKNSTTEVEQNQDSSTTDNQDNVESEQTDETVSDNTTSEENSDVDHSLNESNEENEIVEDTTEDKTEVESTVEVESEATEEEVDTISLPEFEELVAKAEEISKSTDWQTGGLIIKEVKSKWAELTVPEDATTSYKKLEKKLEDAEQAYYNKRSEFYASMDKKRQDNLVAKKALLTKLEALIEKKKWNAVGELNHIKTKWEQIKQIPQEEVESLNAQFEDLSKQFNEKHVEYLVKKKEQEQQNEVGKLYVIDEFKKLNTGITAETDWSSLNSEFENLLKSWKKIGRVPVERADDIWKSFKDQRDLFYSKKMELNDSYRKEIEQNEAKKNKLIDRAKGLKESEDLADAAREINRLHKEWKDIGPVQPDKSEELWTEFKTASDEFNSYKNEHIDEIKDQEGTNYDLKVKICEKAEALSESEDWKKTSDEFQTLLEEWKQIGPVPRRKTKKIWQRFKKAMDNFYAKKRQFFKDVRKEEKDNLKLKKDIIDKVIALHELDDFNEALNQVKELQAEFNKIGFVPIKYKDKIYKQFKEACDVIYKNSRSAKKNEAMGISPNANLDEVSRREVIQKSNQISKLRKQADKIRETILNYSDTKTFIKPNAKGKALIEEMDVKIEKLESELNTITSQINSIKDDLENYNS